MKQGGTTENVALAAILVVSLLAFLEFNFEPPGSFYHTQLLCRSKALQFPAQGCAAAEEARREAPPLPGLECLAGHRAHSESLL